jgi:acyl-CoA reductase-like NAD-dependent aldehyde dehydrogenase
VVLGIAPWNAPVILGARAIATPLACGNTVVLKSSEFCPMTHWLIGDVLRQAGLPPGVCNVVSTAPEGAPAAVEALIRHPAVRRVNFTGSTRTGKVIAKICAEELKPVLLELGGKAPFLVLDDADLDQAVAAAAFGAFMNSGQICMSTERIVVVESVADAFVAKLAQKAATIRAGDPAAAGTILGALADPKAAARLETLIDDAVAKGAILHQAAKPEGALVSAAILDRVTPRMAIYDEESFGPVTTIVRAADENDAIRVANDTLYGLTSAVFTRDMARGLKVAKRLDTGMCHINGPTVHDEAQMPFGGVKASGHGRFGGKAGIDAFTELRWITMNTEPVQYPF